MGGGGWGKGALRWADRGGGGEWAVAVEVATDSRWGGGRDDEAESHE